MSIAAVIGRLEVQAKAHDRLARRFQYLGGKDPATKAAASSALARQQWHEQHASDLRTVIVLSTRSTPGTGEVGCEDCGEKYSSPRFHDLVLPNDVWKVIAPDDGLLCPNCICARLERAGLSGVSSKFTSGPLALRSASKEPEGLTETQLNLLKQLAKALPYINALLAAETRTEVADIWEKNPDERRAAHAAIYALAKQEGQ